MSDEQRLGDRIRTCTVEQTHRELLAIHQHFREVCDWVKAHVNRTERNLTLFNLLSAATGYIHLAANNLQGHVSAFALATRSLYELNLRTRHILTSDDNIRAWHAEAVMDKVQLLEGILQLHTVGDPAVQRVILRGEIDRLNALAAKHNLPTLKHIPNTATIAESVGRGEEHRALFKLFSKIVHPTSYLINDYLNAASSETAMILQTHAQLYAWDLFSRICTELSVPSEVRTFPSNYESGDA